MTSSDPIADLNQRVFSNLGRAAALGRAPLPPQDVIDALIALGDETTAWILERFEPRPAPESAQP